MHNAFTRRRFIQHSSLIASAGLATVPAALASPARPVTESVAITTASDTAHDEAFWAKIRAQFWLPEHIVQLENGNWGVMAKPVMASYQKHSFRVNRDSSYFSRREFWPEQESIRKQVAETLGASVDEITFARGATEVLQSLIGGYSGLQPGDGVMYADVDYDSMQTAMDWLTQRRQAVVEKISVPEMLSQSDILDLYRKALDDRPHIRLLLLTHVSHRHGQIVPVSGIVAMAKSRGVDCIVDAAHSWGQLDFTVEELGADFAAFNLHKWMGAPIGVGVMYIRKPRLDAIEPFMGERAFPADDIRGRIHTGTFNYAALLAVPDALAFHHRLGGANKAARLAYLRNYWVSGAREIPGVDILTADGVNDHAGISSFRIKGQASEQANIAITQRLLHEYGIFTVHRTGLNSGACVRVTPALFTVTAELDRLVVALGNIASV